MLLFRPDASTLLPRRAFSFILLLHLDALTTCLLLLHLDPLPLLPRHAFSFMLLLHRRCSTFAAMTCLLFYAIASSLMLCLCYHDIELFLSYSFILIFCLAVTTSCCCFIFMPHLCCHDMLSPLCYCFILMLRRMLPRHYVITSS